MCTIKLSSKVKLNKRAICTERKIMIKFFKMLARARNAAAKEQNETGNLIGGVYKWKDDWSDVTLAYANWTGGYTWQDQASGVQAYLFADGV